MNMYEYGLLHAKSDREIRNFVAAKLEPMNITLMEWLLLGIVSTGPASGVTMSHIAGELNVTLPQVTALVNKLVPLKYIKQRSDKQDRRSRRVTLTAKGEVILEDGTKALNTAQAEFFAGITDSDRAAYERVITSFANKGA